MTFVERYVSTFATGGGNGSSGSPWTLAEAATNAVAGDRVNIKAGTYTLSATLSPAADGERFSPIEWRGYTTTIGDALAPVVTLDVNGGNFDVVNCARKYHRFRFIEATGNFNQFGPYGFNVSGSGVILHRCRAFDTNRAFMISSDGGLALGCEASGWFFNAAFTLVGASSSVVGCHAHDGGGVGYNLSSADTGGAIYCIARSCTGAGFQSGLSGESLIKQITHCVAYNNTGNGINSASIGLGSPFLVTNTILSGNGGYGIAGTTGGKPHVTIWGTAFYNNTLGEVDSNTTLFELSPRVSLSADPFVDAANGNFQLKPGAAKLLGAGFPSAFLFNGALTSYASQPDIGMVQQPVRPVFNPSLSGAC